MRRLLLLFLLLFLGCDYSDSVERVREAARGYPWQFVASMPYGRYGHDALVAPNGKIYVMGGMVFRVVSGFRKGKGLNGWMIKKINDGRYSNLAYDPKENKWEYMTAIPGWQWGAVVFDPNNDQWRYYQRELGDYSEKEIQEWTRLAGSGKIPMKIYDTRLDRMGNGVAITLLGQNRILWTGGQNFGGNVERIALPYDWFLDKWPRKYSSGETKKSTTSQPIFFWQVDQRERYQTDIPPMQEPRRDHRAVTTADGKVYVLGGCREETAVNRWGNVYNTGKYIVSRTVECYDPVTNCWQYRKPMLRERMWFAAVVGRDGKIYVFGGAAGMGDDPQTPILDTVEVYDPVRDEWTRRKPMPVRRSTHAAVLAADGKIYLLGGGEIMNSIKNTLYIYDPERDSWERGPGMILPRACLAAVATSDGKIYAIGGTDVDAYEDREMWKHLRGLIPEEELRGYRGKVQDTVEVLDIFAWRRLVKGQGASLGK